MMMRSLIVRNMKVCRDFQRVDMRDALPTAAQFWTQSDETPVGWYSNPVDSEHPVVLFTEKALVFGPKPSQRIDWHSIRDYQIEGPKTDASVVHIDTDSGNFRVQMVGKCADAGNARSIYCLGMILKMLVRVRHRSASHESSGGN